MKTLKDAKVGSTVKVVKLHGEGAVKRRIMDMGITRGVEVYIRKVAHDGEAKDFASEDFIIAIMIVMITQAKKNHMTQKETQAMFAKEIDVLYNGYTEITDKEDKEDNEDD